ncbi:MAG: DNA-directed DNA polymerase [Watsoniomyces obsoletus]|nr:MAG: DNA-directed DNA polymerase [Watsoniomyces obsoletus]
MNGQPNNPGRGPLDGNSMVPQDLLNLGQSTSPQPPHAPHAARRGRRERRPRVGRRRRNRRHSFAASTDDGVPHEASLGPATSQGIYHERGPPTSTLYTLGSRGANRSNTSLDSEALLDHRDQQSMPPRRQSLTGQNSLAPPINPASRLRVDRHTDSPLARPPLRPTDGYSERRSQRSRPLSTHPESGGDSDHDGLDDRTPLISSSRRAEYDPSRHHVRNSPVGYDPFVRRPSAGTSTSSRRRRRTDSRQRPVSGVTGDYDVNNPPSVPPSPRLRPGSAYDDVMIPKSVDVSVSPPRRAKTIPGDTLINIDDEPMVDGFLRTTSPQAMRDPVAEHRRRTYARTAQEDVCFPIEGLSEIGEEDASNARMAEHDQPSHRRRRRMVWPDLSFLEEWSLEEKEERSEEIRAKKISEPVLVGGRLRPNNRGWHRLEEDAPYRFTYFNEELPSTIHSQTISELLQPGQSFRDLFIPEPPELSDSESDEDESGMTSQNTFVGEQHHHPRSNGEQSKTVTRQSSVVGDDKLEQKDGSSRSEQDGKREEQTEEMKKQDVSSQRAQSKPKRYGPRPVFWLDVLSPTDAEMRVISKTFGIHPLTAEDILMQEAREKVELFRHYYFVNYRTFEQDVASENYLDPVNMSVVVFREGVISFHFSMMPHPANVRRRIRQLKDYLIPSSDWISYAIIDDITDVFAPLSQSLGEEVDDIEDTILRLHSPGPSINNSNNNNPTTSSKRSEAGGAGEVITTNDNKSDLLRRVGDCRKRVMGLYRLLGNKADVIKGFAKRCNEHWEVAPRSEIGLYLGDIQDHIVTMTGNLSHYESILSRAHSNYLAQINISMNERQEATADVLGKLTVLGTIVLPMNIITGLWGMNCLVPGQEERSLNWFYGITASLACFGICCYFIAKRVYGIV